MLKDRLKELRTQKKLTQAELAKKLSVSQQTIGSWEVGRAEPNSETLALLADLFNVSTDYLLGIEKAQSNNSSTKAQTVAAHIDDNVTEEGMNEILNFIEYIKKRDHNK
ncbi:DNA-binding helix-turn-helix protein [Enterococcus faecalis 13-SD-W-01]|nr:DNA-binding helix-turn-helix protein [Enterococcus faecalis 13-SD-W-01]